MSYVFQFDSDISEPSFEDEDMVWITKIDFWMKSGCFSDQERGVGFPDKIKQVLGNAMEACFEWDNSYTKEQIRDLLLQQGWKELPVGYNIWSNDYPTINNVLTKWKTGLVLARKASEKDQKQGILVITPGGMRCPWCDYECVDDGNFVATCVRNPKHKVRWEPWGG